MTVNRPWTCSPTARFQQRARFRRTTSSGPFDRVPEADSEFAPGYSWPPHLYQENPSVEEAGQPVNGARLSVVGQFAATRLSRTRLCASQRAELGGLARMTERKRSEMHASVTSCSGIFRGRVSGTRLRQSLLRVQDYRNEC
jgi:hypothetical protein